MNKEVEKYITSNYYELLNISKKITKNNQQWAQDLLHFVILELYDKDDIKLKSFDNDTIKYYITSIMRLNWFSKRSNWYYRVMREQKIYVELKDYFDQTDDEEKFETELLYEILETEYSELSWFHKSVFEMYMVLNSLTNVSELTGMPINSVKRCVEQAKKQIKQNIYKKMN